MTAKNPCPSMTLQGGMINIRGSQLDSVQEGCVLDAAKTDCNPA